MTDLSAKSDKDIENWIVNYEDKSAQDQPFYRELLEERARRSSMKSKLDVRVSMSLLMGAAREQSFITYGELADASNVPWRIARRLVDGKSGHLNTLLDVCHSQGMPLLTALCVSKPDLKTQQLSGPALKGFCEGARRFGHAVSDEAEFYRKQRDASWEWGRTQSSSPPS